MPLKGAGPSSGKKSGVIFAIYHRRGRDRGLWHGGRGWKLQARSITSFVVGIKGKKISRDARDREKFLELLAKLKQAYGLNVHGCYVGKSFAELSVKSIAEMVGVDATCVSRSVSRLEGRLAVEKPWREAVRSVVSTIEAGK